MGGVGKHSCPPHLCVHDSLLRSALLDSAECGVQDSTGQLARIREGTRFRTVLKSQTPGTHQSSTHMELI
ncbi:hypothetical protein QQF64_024567 [Cirrhinus molitorella]|uniref:Uncharacterized protein n=1 Tax=Cirrhinus molitorella TaxID=172907 RepID=A0ABR3NLW3_9TELE